MAVKKKITIKKRIEKKIELSNKRLTFINKNSGIVTKITKKMDEGDRLRIYGDGKKPIDVNSFNRNRHEMRNVTPNRNSVYQKKIYVDYDIVVSIPSNERYNKVRNIITQLYQQPTKYTFKIILLNDGSKDKRYDTLINEFPEIIYIKNDVPNGLGKHWYCYNQLWDRLKTIECHGLLQMDDDFILCNNFLNIIVDEFFQVKEKNNSIGAVAPHTWSFSMSDSNVIFPNGSIDGIGLFDINFIKELNHELIPIKFTNVSQGNSAGAWTQIINRLREYKYIIYRTNKSLVWHDGNEDSRLHGVFRRKKAIYTQNYIDNDRKYN